MSSTMTEKTRTKQHQRDPSLPAPAAGGDSRIKKKDSKKGTAASKRRGDALPPAALSSLVGLCWLSHQFGAAVVVGGLVACAVAAGAAGVGKLGKAINRTRKGGLLPTGPSRGRVGGFPGAGKPAGLTGHKSGSLPGPRNSGPGGRGRTSVGGRGGGGAKPRTAASTVSAGRSGGGRSPQGPLSPSGPPARSRGSNSAPGLGSGSSPAGARQKPRTKPSGAGKPGAGLGGAGRRPTPGGAGGGSPLSLSGSGRSRTGKSPKPGGAGGRKGQLGRLSGRAARSNRGWGGSEDGHVRPERLRPGQKTKGPKGPGVKRKDRGKLRAKAKDRKKSQAKKTTSGVDSSARGRSAPAGRSAPMGARRKVGYWAGSKLRKHTSRKLRRRGRAVTAPLRAAARGFARVGSPVAARLWRHGSRAFLKAHMALGSVRYSGPGPAWARPLARLLHTITSPAARLVAASGSWGWLNSWMYRHTSPAKPTKPAAHTTARPTSHRPVHRPAAGGGASIPTQGGTMSSLQPAMPLVYAAEAVRSAGAMLLINPAENMVGYELTIRQLAELQYAISSVVAAAAASTRESFKVNPAVPEAYDDTAGYMRSVGDRLGAIPYLFRLLHAEQIDNIENPTVQAAKWDIDANQR